MNRDQIIKHLKQYTEREQIYLEYYNLRDTPEQRAAFASRFNHNDGLTTRKGLLEGWIFFPEVYPESKPHDIFFSDEMFFEPSANVMVVKHDRYTPLFLHKHTLFELCYVLKGHCIQHISDKDLELKEGDFCFIALETFHSIGVFDDSLILNIMLKQNTFDEIYTYALRNKSVLTSFFINNLYDEYKTDYILFHTGGDLDIQNMILDMYIEQSEQDEYCDNQMTCMMSILLSRLMRKYAKTAELPISKAKDNAWRIDLLNYLQNHYQTATLSDTAAYFNYSPAYCSKLIKKTTGQTFSELLREVRLRHAETLLRTTSISIEKLSYRIGYENPESFSRMFRKSRGMSPEQFRESDI